MRYNQVFTVINIEDYLEDMDSSEPLPADHDAGIIDFHDEPSREEIGKWVDRMSDSSNNYKDDCLLDEPTEESDDPYFRLADLLISNDLI